MTLTADEAAAYFQRLRPEQMRGNPAVIAAGQAIKRMHTKARSLEASRPSNWARLSDRARLRWLVAEYFQQLQPGQMIGNPAIAAAGRAFTRLQRRHAAGPGRPPTVKHDPLKTGCRCAECRRNKYPSYRHNPYGETA